MVRSVVNSAEEVMELLQFGNQMRTVAVGALEFLKRQKSLLPPVQVIRTTPGHHNVSVSENVCTRGLGKMFVRCGLTIAGFCRVLTRPAICRNSRSSRSHAFFNFKCGTQRCRARKSYNSYHNRAFYKDAVFGSWGEGACWS